MVLDDNAATVASLFDLLHIVVEPKRIEEMCDALPEGKREHIARRDAPRPVSG